MRLHVLLLAAWCGAGCYSGARAARDVNPAWRGHARSTLEARLGSPRVVAGEGGTTRLSWIRRGHDVTLPSGRLALRDGIGPTGASVDVDAALRPGSVRAYEYEIAAATVDAAGTVLAFDSVRLAAGIPRGLNLRTGVLFGLHGGMSRLDAAAGPMPGLGVYIGGMLGPRLGLVGAYSFVNGRARGDDYVQGHAWGVAAQYWATPRVSVRAGPALVLDVDPEPGSLELAPGLMSALSVALVRAGSFVLDVRADATLSTASATGMVGLGVHVN